MWMRSPSFDQRVDLHRRHVEVDVLGGDLGVGHELVARFERLGGQRMGGDRRLEHLLGLGEALDVVDVGVRGDQRLALRERKIELPDDLQALVDRVLVADVDQRPVVVVVVDQVDAATDPPPSLVVQLDDVREQRLTLQHGHANPSYRRNRATADDRGRSARPQPACIVVASYTRARNSARRASDCTIDPSFKNRGQAGAIIGIGERHAQARRASASLRTRRFASARAARGEFGSGSTNRGGGAPICRATSL